ncbi:MAG TPA: ExeM/NucH family extracellular endonuclease, partial [Xanthomonadales bacterium]|nr:ExeM/NucH family extracellular endonuclease [Xanthomonadales bacterium]
MLRLVLLPGALACALAGCGERPDPVRAPPSLCQGDHTAISAIQGAGFGSPLVDTRAVARGIVTRVEPDVGFYLEDNDAPGGASRALFVADASISRAVRARQQLAVRGRVAELGSGRDTLTALVEIDGHSVCADAAPLPLTPVSLPLGGKEREALEGMRLELAEPLAVTDHYNLHRGEWTLSSGQPLRLPTEDSEPGEEAAALAARNRRHSIAVVLPGPGLPDLPVGASVSHLVGVLGQRGDEQRLLLENQPAAGEPLIDDIGPPADASVRVVSMNLLNYFNGDGRGGGFPTARGAESPEGFRAQQARTAAALERIQAHLVGVQELENDGFDADSAAHSLLALLNSTGFSDWSFVDPGVGRIGGDVITVGLFYRQQALEAIGPARLLQGGAFDGLSRVPMAQLFRARAGGETFLVAVNHLKSKGSCPEAGPNADQGDGQGCWNAARVQSVEALLPWLDGLAREFATPHVLILGDMNAWRREDPIGAYREGGYVELVEALSGLPQYSFLYFGQRGTLDYALASPALRAKASSAAVWHINADWPRDLQLP